jgi:hypothetical protein
LMAAPPRAPATSAAASHSRFSVAIPKGYAILEGVSPAVDARWPWSRTRRAPSRISPRSLPCMGDAIPFMSPVNGPKGWSLVRLDKRREFIAPPFVPLSVVPLMRFRQDTYALIGIGFFVAPWGGPPPVTSWSTWRNLISSHPRRGPTSQRPRRKGRFARWCRRTSAPLRESLSGPVGVDILTDVTFGPGCS